MAYSRSPVTVRKIHAQLGPLTQGKPCKWTVSPGDAWRWASKVREALHIANLHRDEFPGLARASGMFTIRVLDSSTVEAVQARNTPDTAIVGTSPVVSHGLEQVTRTHNVAPRTANDVIHHWLSVQPTNDRLFYPETEMDDSEVDKIALFMASRTPRWMVLRPKGTKLLTVAPDSHEVPGSAKWHVQPIRSALSGESADPEAHIEDIGEES